MTTTFASHFQTRTRGGGETYITLDDDAPDWLKMAVRDAHQNTLPHDWIYDACKTAALAFDEGALTTDEDDDDVHEWANGEVNVYTQELFQWAANFCLTDTWACAHQEAKDMGMRDGEIDKQIAFVQYTALRHIGDTMKRACAKAATEIGKLP